MTRPNFNWKLPAAIEARLGTASYGAQRAIYEEEHLLLVLHEPPDPQKNQREPAVFLRQPAGKWLHHGVDNGHFALQQLLDRYQKILGELEALYIKAGSADDLFHILEKAIPAARAASNLKDALQAARELVKTDRLLIDSRDRMNELSRGLELLLADARLALDYRLARNAEAQVQTALAANRAQLKLNILAALTLPLMAIATLFGMNLHSGLENGNTLLFWGILTACLILGLLVKSRVHPGEPAIRPAPPAKRKR